MTIQCRTRQEAMKPQPSFVLLLAGSLLACCAALHAQSNPSAGPAVSHPQSGFDAQFLQPSTASALDPPLKNSAGLIEQGNYPAAAEILRGYVHDHPDSADAHYLLGYALYRTNKPADSLAEYTAAAHLRKPAANDIAAVAMDYVLLHDESDADKWLTMAIKWEPQNATYWYFLGRTKYNENRFEEAILAFEECLRIHPRDVRAEYNLGLSYVGLGRTDEAESAYRAAIAWQQGIEREDPQPYLDLGSLLVEKNQLTHALELLKKAVAIDPQNPKIHEALGRAYETQGNFSAAEDELKTAVSLSPGISALHFELGRIYKRENKQELAKSEFAQSATLNSSHSTDSQPTPNPSVRVNK